MPEGTPYVTIRPIARGGVEPYPWHVERDGSIRRQDFWKGHPFELAGFVTHPEATGDIHLTVEQFWEEPGHAVGMWPVFVHGDGRMATWGDSMIMGVNRHGSDGDHE
jgi:hypothetical protein